MTTTANSNIVKGQKVTSLETGKVETIKNVEKRGRWIYVTVGNNPEMTEKQFNAAYSTEVEAVSSPAKAPKVKKVSAAHVEDAITGSEIEEGSILGLTGFAKFRALHKPVTVELPNSGQKARIQDNGDDVAHQLLCEIDEVMDAKGCEAAEAIWKTPLVKNNLDVKALQARYASLNFGMVRMNLGNRLRSLFRKQNEEHTTKK